MAKLKGAKIARSFRHRRNRGIPPKVLDRTFKGPIRPNVSRRVLIARHMKELETTNGK